MSNSRDHHLDSRIAMPLDEILEKIPVGTFHYRLLVMTGFAFGADAMEVGLLSFMATCAGVEWSLTNKQIATITSAVFFGELLGGSFFGPMADKYGRKNTYLLACVLIVLGGIASGASPDLGTLVFLRAIVGFGVGGLTVPFDLLAEFMPTSSRGQFLLYIEYFWAFGSIFVSFMAWAFLESQGWRFLTYMTAIPVAVATLLSFIFHDGC
jgi:MFS family permease